MHFTISEYCEVSEPNESSYTAFSIYINGVFHSNMRYSQLNVLNERLRQFHGSQTELPYFPPKKFFPMSKTQLEERQYCLEKYLQGISQQSELVNSPVLRRFLFNAQRKMASRWHSDNDLTVLLLNGTQTIVRATYDDSTDEILQRVCDNLRFPDDAVRYFSLFVQQQSENGDISLIHMLQDYECPVITMKYFSKQCKVVLRKSYWDTSLDLKMMSDRSTLHYLYWQTVSDVGRGWIVTNPETQEELATLQSKGAKREYLDIARTLKYYGYVKFDGCTCDYPDPGTEIVVSLGQKDMVFTPKSDSLEDKEFRFRITRIRCWKITPLNEFNKEVQLSFEYLVATDKLQWITIISDFVFIISVCLQSIVDELMIKKGGSTDNDNSQSSDTSNNNGIHSATYQKSGSKIKRSRGDSTLNAKMNDLKINVKKQSHFVPLLENQSFETIGDDDL